MNDKAFSNKYPGWDGLDLFRELLDKFHSDYRSGDKISLLYVISVCANGNLKIPEWAKNEINEALRKLRKYEVRTLDEAFNIKKEKGHLNALKKRSTIGPAIYERVIRLHAIKKPIDSQLFEEVGKEFNIGKTLASQYYYYFRDLYNKKA